MSIYVEIRIRAEMEDVWRLTQTPELHEQWDLRFSDIEYLPCPDATQPQRFLYATRIGFGLRVCGEGESVGNRESESGVRTSVLKFWSDDRKSLIREGSGYWKYVPTEDGIRFFTKYDYSTRFGAIGGLVDRLVFRPLIGWATAWSFDCMRLWAEKGIHAGISRQRSMVYGIARLSLALIWIYQGIFPKLLFPDSGELNILRDAGIFNGREPQVLMAVGWAEILFGLLFLVLWRVPLLFVINILALIVLAGGVVFSNPALFIAPFNPLTLNGSMIALSLVGWLCRKDLPSARHCLRRMPRGASSEL